jgi:hypothetical protein
MKILKKTLDMLMKHIVQAYSRLQMREIMSTLSYFQAHASGIHTFNNMEGPSK